MPGRFHADDRIIHVDAQLLEQRDKFVAALF
jgi:hypothetical protein